MEDIRVSIVVPVYNSHVTLPKCLDSLIAQSWKNLEIICVNDKSKDNSVAIIKEYQKKDSRVKLVDHAENMNAGGARNSGIRAANGEYVCFCDNDDWMIPEAIEILVKATDEGRVDFVASQWCQYWNENHKNIMQNLVVGGSKEENREYALMHGCRILGCLIRRNNIIENDLLYPEKTFFEDNAIGMALVFSANEIKVVDRVLYYYQMVEGSSSRSISLVKIKDRIKTSGLFLDNMTRLGYVTMENKEMVEYHYLCYSYFTIRMLASVGTEEAYHQLSVVADKTKNMLPNAFIKQYHKNFESVLSHPVLYYYLWKFAYMVKRVTNRVHK